MNKEWLDQTVFKNKHRHANFYVVDWLEPEIHIGRGQLDQYLDEVVPYKHDLTTTVAKLSVNQFELVLKRYNARSLGHIIKRALRKSRAKRCWDMSYVFAKAGLNVATPYIMYEERFFVFRKHAYFASQYLRGEELLTLLPTMDKAEQLNVAEAFKKAMEIMRRHKISHGDMKASNLLWVNGNLFFIDLDAAMQHSSKASWQRSNRRDRKRFLKNWRDFPELELLFSWLK